MSHDLFLLARTGDTVALESLIRAYQSPVGRFVVSQLGTQEDYLDLCQIIFVKVVRGLPRLKEATAFEPWLYRIARNVCIDHLRRLRWQRRLFVPLAEGHEAVPAEDSPPPGRSLDSIQVAVAQLGVAQRELLDLSVQQHRTYEELANLTNTSVVVVRNRLFRVRERLKQVISGRKEPQ